MEEIDEIVEVFLAFKDDPQLEGLTNSEIIQLVAIYEKKKSRTVIRLEAGDTFGHEICMGVRAALFGADAGHNESISSLTDLTVTLDK